jgi:RHS repeat-associated protein
MANASSYDVAGNRLSEIATLLPAQPTLFPNQYTNNFSHTRSFTYDNRDHLTGESLVPSGAGDNIAANNFTQYFDYDAVGNTTNFRGASPGLSANTFNIDNQIGNTGFGFDGNGDATTHFSTAYTFDGENRLTAIASPSFSATYGPDELRAKKVASGVTTYYLTDTDGLPVMAETWTGTTGHITQIYARGADGLRQIYNPDLGSYYTFIFDPEGNVAMRQNSGWIYGMAQDIAVYDSYGNLLADQRPTNQAWTTHRDSVGFAGQWGGETDWEVNFTTNTNLRQYSVLMTHRYYDPRTGRFINRDPIGYQGGVNVYGYAGGNPVNFADPSGLDVTLRLPFLGPFQFGGDGPTGYAAPSSSTGGQPSLGRLRGNVGASQAELEEMGVSQHKLVPGRASQRLRTGIDKSLEMGAAMLPIPIGKAEAVAEESEIVALGVKQHLPEFTDMIKVMFGKGSNYWHWGQSDFKHQFLAICSNPNTQIHFNLTMADGSMMNVWKALHEGSVPMTCQHYTSWEIAQVHNNGWLPRTTFWYKGQIVPNPFE